MDLIPAGLAIAYIFVTAIAIAWAALLKYHIYMNTPEAGRGTDTVAAALKEARVDAQETDQKTVLPEAIRPSALRTTAMLSACLFYGGFSLFVIWSDLLSRLFK